MKPASLILPILCILCISTQNAQAIDIVIPDGKGGKYFCDSEKGYSAVESEKSRLQGQGYEVHLTIEDTNCWISYIIQSSKEGKTESSRYNISKGTSGCGEIYAKAGCGTDTKRESDTMCSSDEAEAAAGSHLSDCISAEGEYCKKYSQSYGGCNPGKCEVEWQSGGCKAHFTVVSKGRWTAGGGVWTDIVYYTVQAPACTNPSCGEESFAAFGCPGWSCGENDPTTGTTTTTIPSGGGPIKPSTGSNKKCSEIEAVNAAKNEGGGYLITNGDGKCWRYAIGESGTFMYPYNEEIGNPDSECCPAYGMAGCVGFCRVKGQDVYNFSSGGEMPSNEECSICDYLKKMEENKLDYEKMGQEIAKQIFSKENMKVGDDGTSTWSKIGDQIINEKMRQEIADEIENELFDTESLENFRDTALNPSEASQQIIDDLKEEVDIQSDIDFTVENLRVKYEQNVVITEEENKSYEEDYSKIMIGIFDDTKDYILKAPAFNIFSDKKITASGECKFQIPSPMGWYNSETAYFDIDFCKYKDALNDMSIVFRLIAVIAAVAIILGS